MSTRTEPQRLAGLRRTGLPHRPDALLGPVNILADERDRLGALRWQHFDARLLGTTIGAELSGVDLRADLDDDTIEAIRQALVAYKVLVFRDQDLTAEEHARFARRFGELEVHPFLAGSDELPELVHLAKDEEVGGYENIWHSDVTWRQEPALGAVLRAVEVPEHGGDTMWADMAAAYEGLDPDVRHRIDHLDAVHDFTLSFGLTLGDDALEEARRAYPPVTHPVVRTHPESGAHILYVNRIFTSHLVGLPRDESEELLAHLFRQAEVPEYQVRLRWEAGTVAFWDNRSTQHYALSDYWPQRRVMQRAAIVGDRPR
jgi:taurine dioxygenase